MKIFSNKIDGIILSPQKIIDTNGGNVLHIIKNQDETFSGFGEAYFSFINYGVIKGWKRHTKMTMNLVVPIGEIQFVIFDDRKNSKTYKNFQEIILSMDNYCRLTVPPMLWMAFKGRGDQMNLLLNVSNIEHNPKEVENKSLESFPFKW